MFAKSTPPNGTCYCLTQHTLDAFNTCMVHNITATWAFAQTRTSEPAAAAQHSTAVRSMGDGYRGSPQCCETMSACCSEDACVATGTLTRPLEASAPTVDNISATCAPPCPRQQSTSRSLCQFCIRSFRYRTKPSCHPRNRIPPLRMNSRTLCAIVLCGYLESQQMRLTDRVSRLEPQKNLIAGL